MSDRYIAKARMEAAKAAYTRAAQAAIAGLPLATTLAQIALEELNAARAALASADTTSAPPS
jgi:hypothetical protein